MWDIPTPREELDRKTIDSLDWVVGLLEQGKISPAAAAVAVQAVWTAVSGLASEDVTQLVTMASKECRQRMVG